MSRISKWEDLEEKYTFRKDRFYFEYYPYEGRVHCENNTNLLMSIHFLGKCGFNINWQRCTKTDLYIESPEHLSQFYFMDMMNLSIKDLDSPKKRAREKLLSNNFNYKTGKPLDIFVIRSEIYYLTTSVKAKKKGTLDILRYFNYFNIKEDIERVARGGSILVESTKSKKTLIREGKDALERLFKKGKLKKLTDKDYLDKMEKYGE